MKAKKLGLLAVSAMVLALPFTASAGIVGNIDVKDNKGKSLSGYSHSFTGLTVDVSANPLKGKWSVIDSVKQLAGNNQHTVSFISVVEFKVAQASTFAGSASITAPVNDSGKIVKVELYDATTNKDLTATLNGSGNQYNFKGLKAGDLYEWKVTGTVTGPGNSGLVASSSKTSMLSQFTVAAVPEPEEWAMMLVGVGLVSFQVRRNQKRMSQLAL